MSTSYENAEDRLRELRREQEHLLSVDGCFDFVTFTERMAALDPVEREIATIEKAYPSLSKRFKQSTVEFTDWVREQA